MISARTPLATDKTSAITTGTFAPKQYLGTNMVKSYLDSTKAKVITVYSGDTAKGGDEQSAVMSTQSGATSNGTTTGTPLTYVIPTDGSTLGEKVVTAVKSLVGAMQMNLTLVLNPSPHSPPVTSPFGFKVEANGSTSNCNPTTTDTDGNGLKDTYVACGPGAAPSWNVTFTNPANNPVPLNSTTLDANGGYQMKIQVIGDRNVPAGFAGFVVDEIPVYIIPTAIPEPPAETKFSQSGTYAQTISSKCSGTNAPIWRWFDWNASLPTGTSLDFRSCGGLTSAEVRSCSALTFASLTSSNVTCTTANQATTCGTGSVCGKSNRCETLRSTLACTPANNGSECGTGGVCVTVAGDSRCHYSARPADLAKVIAAQQGKPYLRFEAGLNASSDRLSSPTLYDWRLDYVCAPNL